MSGRKRPWYKNNHEGVQAVKRITSRRTVEKWIAENDKSLQMLSWLCFETLSD